MELDYYSLKISQEKPIIQTETRAIITKYHHRLDEFMQQISSYRTYTDETHEKVITLLLEKFKTAFNFHGDPRWLLTTKINYGHCYGLFGSNFIYSPVTEEILKHNIIHPNERKSDIKEIITIHLEKAKEFLQ